MKNMRLLVTFLLMAFNAVIWLHNISLMLSVF